MARKSARISLVARDAVEPDLELDDNENIKEVQDDDEAADASEGDHLENLATIIDDTELTKIAAEVIERVDADIASRATWSEVFKRGLKIMGLERNEVDDGPFPGAAIVTHPLMNEAIVQFWARAMSELFPPTGAVKGKVLGKENDKKLQAAVRIEDYMNYQLQFEDKGYRSETSRLIFAIPQTGSAFRKTFRNTEMDFTQGIYVAAENFIVPFVATSLDTSPRFTHRQRFTPNEMKKRMKSGLYRKIDLPKPALEQLDDVEEKKAATQDATPSTIENDARHTIYECYADWDMPGYEDTDGVELPYIITVEKDSSKVLSIRRNWCQEDDLMEKRIYFTHYEYIPGFGFYGLGLFHLIGALSEAATGALRAILDGAAFASLQGGFKTRDAATLKGGTLTLEPGVYKDVDMSYDDLSKCFYTPPFKEPSPVLAEVLGLLVDAGRRFASITETLVGEADNKAPVGTTVALIEQGTKVFTTIHQGLHASANHEFRLRYDINCEFMPDEGYSYDVHGDEGEIFKEDFGKHTDVVPVSDPNMSSTTHRIAVSQAGYQLYKENPQFYDGLEMQRRMLEALKFPDYESLLIDPESAMPMDPVAENQAIMTAKMVKTFPEQDHSSHLQVHLALANNPGFLANPQLQEWAPQIMAAMQAHIAQHLASLHSQQVSGLGIPTYIIDFAATRPQKIGVPEDVRIGVMAAQHAAQITQFPGLPLPPPKPDPAAEQQQKIQFNQQDHDQEQQLKNDAHTQEMARTKAKADQDIAITAEKARQSIQVSAATSKQGIQQKAEDHTIDAGIKTVDHQQAMKEQAEQHAADMANQEADHAAALDQSNLDHAAELKQQQDTHKLDMEAKTEDAVHQAAVDQKAREDKAAQAATDAANAAAEGDENPELDDAKIALTEAQTIAAVANAAKTMGSAISPADAAKMSGADGKVPTVSKAPPKDPKPAAAAKKPGAK